MTELDQHLDNILKASGSGLKNYSMQKTLNDMRNALKAALAVEREACAKVCEARAKDFLALYTKYHDEQDNGAEISATQCAKYIRARGEQA
jgi:hypothetical protein